MTTKTTKRDIDAVRQALQIAARAKPTPIWECEDALPSFERLAEKAWRYEDLCK